MSAVKEQEMKKVSRDLKEKGSLGIKQTNKKFRKYIYVYMFSA